MNTDDHDPRIDALAKDWLKDHTAPDKADLVWGLAETIQQAVDDYMNDLANGRIHRSPLS